MWEAIERLQQGESLNIQDVKTNLFWEFGQFTSHDGETIESYYTRFYKMMNEMIRNNLTVATMQVNVQFLQQLQPEWSRFVTIVKQQHKLDELKQCKILITKHQNLSQNHSAPTQSFTSNQISCNYKIQSKEIAKPITPPSESASEEDSDPEKAQKDKDMQKNWLSLQRCRKPKTGLRHPRITRKMLLCKQAEKVSTLSNNLTGLADTDERDDEQELEAHHSYMQRFRRFLMQYSGHDAGPHWNMHSDSISNTCAVETGDSNAIPDSPDMCANDIQGDQNDVECDDEQCLHC
ncbi:hypothetical protein Tco_1103474 [Tanacetum coccineum]